MMEKMKVFNKFSSFKKLLISLVCLYFLQAIFGLCFWQVSRF